MSGSGGSYGRQAGVGAGVKAAAGGGRRVEDGGRRRRRQLQRWRGSRGRRPAGKEAVAGDVSRGS